MIIISLCKYVRVQGLYKLLSFLNFQEVELSRWKKKNKIGMSKIRNPIKYMINYFIFQGMWKISFFFFFLLFSDPMNLHLP